ncbi:MAG TPA: NADH-quinone oxidoreductase subunit L [Bacteroidia bacterium]
MIKLIALVPLLPLLGWLALGLFGKKMSKGAAGAIGCITVLGSFILSLGIFNEVLHKPEGETVMLFDWIRAGNFSATFSFLIDPLSSLFLLIITGVGSLIHVYSTAYMKEDEGFYRFFAYLNLFIFFMLLLVLGNNYLIMFVGWEGVGLCSYLLIGFWFKNTAYNNAAKKAFIMNRIGDLGFLLGIMLIFITFGSITYKDVFDIASSPSAGLSGSAVITSIGLLLFIGAMGKSAQIPLYTWLPDAMAGPTPVSALIHAATMVTAGIYMVARSNILYTLSPVAMDFVAIIGVLTALFAATIGLFQNDIKKVLAYSTVSQLGYMFLGLGVGAYTGSVFHVMTHAFFKALLFLAAGSVIHAMHHEQDIRRMGGLKKYLPVTFATFLIGTIAISGIPPFAGFFSKDEILAHAYERSPMFWFLGVIGSLLTAFYMFRLLYLTFFGEFRGSEEQEHHLHESPKAMTIPLVVLAVLSVVGGFIGIPEVFAANSHWLEKFLAPVFEKSEGRLFYIPGSSSTEMMHMGIAVAGALAMAWLAYRYFVAMKNVPAEDEEETSRVQKVIYHKYYVDELYAALITKPIDWLSDKFYRFVELRFVDATVNGIGNGIRWMGGVVRYVQTGNVGSYILLMVLSIVLILFVKLL